MPTAITLQGKYLDLAGNPAVGTVSFELSGPLLDSTGNVIYPSLKRVESLDDTGAFSVSLPATKGDAGTAPQGLTYKIRESISPNLTHVYAIELDKDLGLTQDLADIAPAVNVTTNTYALVSALNTHVAATESVHGIADTAQLATLSYVDAHAATWGNVTGTLSAQTDLATALNAKLDTTTYSAFTPNVNRMPVLTVASSTASAKERALADYACDGTADDVQLQAAINALPTGGGTIMLSAGTFSLAAKVTLPTGVRLVGQGHVATVIQQANGANLDWLIESANYATLSAGNVWFVADGMVYGMALEHLQVHGNRVNQTGGTGGGVHLWAKHYVIHDVVITQCRGSGLYCDGSTLSGQNDWFDTPECMIGPLWVSRCGGTDAVYYNGPHDGIFGKVISGFNDGTGFHIGPHGGCDIEFVHSYANGQASMICDGAVSCARAYPETSTTQAALILNSTASGSYFGAVRTTSSGTWVTPGHIVCHADDCTFDDVVLHAGSGSNAVLIDSDGVALRGVLDSCAPTATHIQLGTAGNPANHCLIDVTVKAAQAQVLAIDSGGAGNIVRVAANLSGTATSWDGTKGATDIVDYTSGIAGGFSRNAGLATIASGTTSIAVPHGLVRPPNLSEIQVTPASSLGSAATFWVTNLSSTKFTINVNANPAQAVNFSWHAELSAAAAPVIPPLLLAHFTGTDGTLLTAYTPDTGSTFSLDVGTSPKLASNQLVASNTSLAHAHANVGVADGTLQASVTCATGSVATIIIRSTDSNNHIGFGINSSCKLSFYSIVAGTSTDLTLGVAPTYTSGSTHTLKVVYSGSTISGYVDGVLYKTVTVTDNATSTNVGVRYNSGTAASIDDLQMTA